MAFESFIYGLSPYIYNRTDEVLRLTGCTRAVPAFTNVSARCLADHPHKIAVSMASGSCSLAYLPSKLQSFSLLLV